jgi:acetyl esterase/lipase/limonene-1,2-epoxide hydrolase
MRKTILLLSILGLILAACQTPTPEPTPEPTVESFPEPEAVVESFAKAFNAQDPDRAMAHLAEAAVVSIVPATPGTPGTYTGQAEIRSWLEGLMALNAQLEVAIQGVEESTVTAVTRYSDDALQDLGVRYLEGAEEYVVEKGKISRLTFTTSEKSLAELQLATLKAAAPTHADVPYVDGGAPEQVLDIYLPEGEEGPFPIVFFVPGSDDTKDNHNALAGYFASKGYGVVAIDNRELGEPDRAFFVEDTFCALAWVHANAAQYGLDAQRIVAVGYSIGGLCAATLAAADDPEEFLRDCPYSLPETGWVQGVATYAGLFVTPEVCLSPVGWCVTGAAAGNQIPLNEMLAIFEELQEVPPADWSESEDISGPARAFAHQLPLYWVDGSEPPFLLVHGAADELVSPGESEAFAAWLQSAGVAAEFVLMPGTAEHWSIYPASPNFLPIVETIEAFAAGVVRK